MQKKYNIYSTQKIDNASEHQAVFEYACTISC